MNRVSSNAAMRHTFIISPSLVLHDKSVRLHLAGLAEAGEGLQKFLDQLAIGAGEGGGELFCRDGAGVGGESRAHRLGLFG
jgi:hypothetical protein